MITRGAIDCDIHPAVPGTTALLPYLDDYWRDQIVNRHIHKQSFHLQSYPPNSPLSCRPDWRPKDGAAPGSDLDLLRAQALDAFGTRFAICNTLHGAISLFNEDMAAALIAAVNDYIAREWLDREPRLRASILLPLHNPELAVKEIERLAHDKRFVQVLMPVMGEMPLGRRMYWPIYEACERHGLTVGVHAGSTYRTSPTAAGWPSYQVEDYIAQSGSFENLLLSFIAEGVFQKFPEAQARLHRVRLHLAADAALAHQQDLARRARRGAVARPAAGRHHPRARALHAAAARPAGERPAEAPAHARAYRQRRPAACSRPTIRTGNSRATRCCRTGFRML